MNLLLKKADNLESLIAKCKQEDAKREKERRVNGRSYIDDCGIHWDKRSLGKLDLWFYQDLGFIDFGISSIIFLYILGSLLRCYALFNERDYVSFFLYLICMLPLVYLGHKGCVSLKCRKPNAIYLCNAFVWISFVFQIINITLILVGGSIPGYIDFFIPAGCLAVLYELYSAYDMKKLFPKEYRFASKRDKMLVWGCVMICIILYVVPLIGILFLAARK